MSFYELYSTATPLLLPSAEWMYRLPGDLFGSLLLITMKGLADQRRPPFRLYMRGQLSVGERARIWNWRAESVARA